MSHRVPFSVARCVPQLATRRQFRWLHIAIIGVVSASVLASCGSSSDDTLCGPSRSIGVVASAIAIGQFEFDETDGGSTLRLEVLSAIAQLDVVIDDGGEDLVREAQYLKVEFEEFLDVSDSLEWDDVAMTSDVVIDSIGTDLNSDAGVYATTAVDSYFSAVCASSTNLEDSNNAALPTLPPPPIPSPTDTDPPMEMVDSDVDALALGETIGALFGLELTPELSLCLGKTLSEIPDASGNNGPDEYVAQYQKAFDACGIIFQIPIS